MLVHGDCETDAGGFALWRVKEWPGGKLCQVLLSRRLSGEESGGAVLSANWR